jgi:hypothetical protein
VIVKIINDGAGDQAWSKESTTKPQFVCGETMRPLNAILNTAKLDRVLGSSLPPWQKGVDEIFLKN